MTSYHWAIWGGIFTLGLVVFLRYQILLRKTRRRLMEKNSDIQKATLELDRVKRSHYELLTYINHEIRTPLNAVIGLSDLLLESDLEVFQRKYLEMVHKSGAVLLDLLGGLLDLHEIETGSLERKDRLFNLSDVIENIQTLYGPQAREKGLELTGHISPDLPMVLVGDDVRLRQVLINLVTNAIRFTFKGAVRIEVQPDKQYGDQIEVRFSVLDTGVGIPPEEQARIFEGAPEAESGFMRRQSGAGLGLAISAGLVRLMGGRIWAESPNEWGGAFHFILSFRTATRAEAYSFVVKTVHELEVEKVDHPPQLENLRILVAEDNVFNQTMIAAYLEQEGAWVTLAGNGREALEALNTGEFDAVLMDVQMPEMDGLEATRQIRENKRPQDKRHPIIALTACSIAEEKHQALAAGMDTCQNKPIRPHELVDTILETIDRLREEEMPE